MGVNRQIFKPIAQSIARKQCHVSENQKVILFVGNLLEQKGLLELMDAVRLVRKKEENIQLYLIGSQKDPAFKKQMDEKIRENHLLAIVNWLGEMEQSNIALWMCAADCLVLPSHIEGFGLVALEAMACGTPVVGTNVGGLNYLLENGAGYITPAKNAEKLADSLALVLSSEKDKRKV